MFWGLGDGVCGAALLCPPFPALGRSSSGWKCRFQVLQSCVARLDVWDGGTGFGCCGAAAVELLSPKDRGIPKPTVPQDPLLLPLPGSPLYLGCVWVLCEGS